MASTAPAIPSEAPSSSPISCWHTHQDKTSAAAETAMATPHRATHLINLLAAPACRKPGKSTRRFR